MRWHEPCQLPLFERFHPVDHNLFVRFFRSGHVTGALSVAVHWGPPGPTQRSIVFSGDLGPNSEDQEGLPFLRHWMHVGENDYAVVESTYGATVRSAEQTEPEYRRCQLRELLDKTMGDGGNLIVPAFSLGRVQDVLFDLHCIVAENPERYKDVRFFIDAPSARKMSGILLEAVSRTENNGRNGKVRPVWLGKQMFRWFRLVDTNPAHVQTALDICRMTLTPKEEGIWHQARCGNTVARAWRPIFNAIKKRKQFNPDPEGRATVFVVSSGSCDGGPAAWWLPRLLGSAANTVALAGYCSPGTVGGQLLSLAQAGVGDRQRLTGSLDWPDGVAMWQAEIKAGIVALSGYSAHADQAGLLDCSSMFMKGGCARPAGRSSFSTAATPSGQD